ncbi:MAG TPA: lysophospholipid acyltransferase family protein [Chthoniobacterales bacterium]|nr:lysophospholipid acyltransferase family protein [Chthoniobacterales bacterium]
MPLTRLAERFFYGLSKRIIRTALLPVCRIQVVYFATLPSEPGYIIASNHISHFDPPILSALFPHNVDWMTMEEMFRNPASAFLMKLLSAFKVRRDGSDRIGIRTALNRLAESRVVGLFPEGGIRAGSVSVLEGAPMWPGAAALSVLSGKPIVPVVILGTDRLYDPRNWLRFRRVRVWIGFGEQIVPRRDLGRRQARELVQASLSNAFLSMKHRIVATFRLAQADLPATPQARKREDYLPDPRR